jgi:hypothetical protein
MPILGVNGEGCWQVPVIAKTLMLRLLARVLTVLRDPEIRAVLLAEA